MSWGTPSMSQPLGMQEALSGHPQNDRVPCHDPLNSPRELTGEPTGPVFRAPSKLPGICTVLGEVNASLTEATGTPVPDSSVAGSPTRYLGPAPQLGPTSPL